MPSEISTDISKKRHCHLKSPQIYLKKINAYVTFKCTVCHKGLNSHILASAKTTGHAKFLDTIEVQGLYITVLSLTNSISFNLPHNIQTHDSKFKASHNI